MVTGSEGNMTQVAVNLYAELVTAGFKHSKIDYNSF